MTSLRVPDAPKKQATVLGQGAEAVPALVDGAGGAWGGVMTVFCLVELDGGAGEGGAAAVADVSLRALTLARGLPLRCDWLAGVPERGGGGVAAVVFAAAAGGRIAAGGRSWLVADLAAYGVTDVYAVSGIDGYAPLAWARVLQWLVASTDPGCMNRPASRRAGSSGHAVVAAGTERGNEVLAHLGAITGLPMAANCVHRPWITAAVRTRSSGSAGPGCCLRRRCSRRRPRC